MHITLNGQRQEIADNATVAALVKSLGHDPARVLVELNGQVLPIAEYEKQRLGEGDRIELLVFVGGG